MRTRTSEGTDWPVTLRQAASWVPDPSLRSRISLAPEVHLTAEPRLVSTKVSSTSPGAVPAGTAVTAVTALADSKVVAAPTWVMVAVVVDASRGTTPMPAAMSSTTMMAISAPMIPLNQRETAGRLRQVILLRRRGPVSSVPLGWFEPVRCHCSRFAGMFIPFCAIWCDFRAMGGDREPNSRMSRRANSDDLDGT
jgi:hypothetical protein